MATLLNYSKVSTETGVTLTIAPGSGDNLQVWNNGGPTDLVIDVTGYYIPPLAAFILTDGTAYSGTSRVISSTKTSQGVYEVKFDRVTDYCSATASA